MVVKDLAEVGKVLKAKDEEEFDSKQSTLYRSVKRLITIMNAQYRGRQFSVKEKSLTSIADEAGVPKPHQGKVWEILSNVNLIERDGYASGMRWMWKEVVDACKYAKTVEDKILRGYTTSKVKVKPQELKIVQKSYYAISDIVYFMHDNKVCSGFIASSSLCKKELITDTTPFEERIVKVTTSAEIAEGDTFVVYDIIVDSERVECVNHSDVFPTLQLLLDALKVRFTLSNKTEVAPPKGSNRR